jgi:hypothetical protein
VQSAPYFERILDRMQMADKWHEICPAGKASWINYFLVAILMKTFARIVSVSLALVVVGLPLAAAFAVTITTLPVGHRIIPLHLRH